MLTLALRGVRGRNLALEKSIHQTVEFVLADAEGITLVGSTINVTLLSHDAAEVDIVVRTEGGETAPDSLAETIATKIRDETECGCRSVVTIEVIPCQTYSTL
jgi:hypothetical protein